MLKESNETESNWSNGWSSYEGGNAGGWGGFPGFWSPITFLFSVDLSYNIAVGRREWTRQKGENVSMVINCLEDFLEIWFLKRTLQISEVGVINVKLEVFVLNVKIYENLLLILNLCKVSKLCIVTEKELDVDFSFMNNVTSEEVNQIILLKSKTKYLRSSLKILI